jgi:hypothetical protein
MVPISMNPELNYFLAQQRAAQLRSVAERARLASEPPSTGTRAARAPRHIQPPPSAGFTLRGHHLAKLDRFLGQAKRSAVGAGRDFEGVTIEIDAQGVVSVHATGMTSMKL